MFAEEVFYLHITFLLFFFSNVPKVSADALKVFSFNFITSAECWAMDICFCCCISVISAEKKECISIEMQY